MTFNKLVCASFAFILAMGPYAALAGSSSSRILNATQIKNGSGALVIPSSGTATIQSGTYNVVGTTTTDVLTNKDHDGGTASNTSRITLPKASTSTLSGLTRKQGTIAYDTTKNKPVFDNGSTLTAIGTGGGSGSGINYLTSGGFEDDTSHTGWTVTTATAANETSTLYEGLNSTKLTYSSQTGGISQDVTPTQNTASVNMEASCKVNTTMTTIQVCGRSGGSDLSNCSSVPSTGTWQYVAYNFVGPANGTSVGVDVKTSASGTGTVYVDDCYVGPARNLSQVSQANFYGSLIYPGGNGSCSWLTASSSFSDASANTNCNTPTASGAITAPATKVPQAVANNAPAGAYHVVANFNNGGAASSSTDCRLVDDLGTQIVSSKSFQGAITVPQTLAGAITYTTAANHTFKIQCKNSGSNSTGIYADETGADVSIFVYYFPTQAQTAYNANQTAGSQQSHTGITGYGSTNTVVLRYTNNTVSRGSDITYATSASLGDSWTINSSGSYCITGTLRESAGGNEWNIGRNVSGTISSDPSGTGLSSTGDNGWIAKAGTVGGQPAPIAWCGYLAQNDVIISAVKAGLTFSTNSFVISKVNNTSSAPVIVNSVTSSYTGTLKFEALKVASACSSSPCTMTLNTGGFSSVTRAAGPTYTINFTAGAFSSAPACNVLMGDASHGLIFNPMSPPTNTTSFSFVTTNTSGTGFDAGFDVTCTGPR